MYVRVDKSSEKAGKRKEGERRKRRKVNYPMRIFDSNASDRHYLFPYKLYCSHDPGSHLHRGVLPVPATLQKWICKNYKKILLRRLVTRHIK